MKMTLSVFLLSAGLVFGSAPVFAGDVDSKQADSKHARSKPVSAKQEQWIRSEILRLVHEHAIDRDNRDAAAAAKAFAKDGALVHPKKRFTGRDVIEARLAAEPKNVVVFHEITTSKVTVVSKKKATGIHHAAIYDARTEDSHVPGTPIKVKGPAAMGKYHDEYQLTEEGWKISERRFEWVLSFTED